MNTSNSEQIIKDELPDTFYAGLEPRERLKIMVKKFYRAVEVVNKYEEDISSGKLIYKKANGNSEG